MARQTDDRDRSQKPSAADELLWLETYFITFPQERRPTLAQVEHALAEAGPRLKLKNLAADEEGFFQSLLVESPEDHAAVEISYELGDAVIEQNLQWAKQLEDQLSASQLQQLIIADARLDVAHFERLPAGAPRTSPKSAAPTFAEDEYGDDFDEEAAMEVFDPTCLLTVVEALSQLTKGLTVDPASGEIA